MKKVIKNIGLVLVMLTVAGLLGMIVFTASGGEIETSSDTDGSGLGPSPAPGVLWDDSGASEDEPKIDAVGYKFHEGGKAPDGSRRMEGQVDLHGAAGSAAVGTPALEGKFDIKGDDMKLSDLKDATGFEAKIVTKDGKEHHVGGARKE